MEELGKWEAEFEKWRTEALIDVVETLDELEKEYRVKMIKYGARSMVANSVLAKRAMAAAAADEKEGT
jgi:hypothetical protein